MAELVALRDEGKVRFIGMSGTLPNIEEHISTGVFDVFQIPYSAIEREHEETISEAAAAGAGTIIRGGVARGIPAAGPESMERLPERFREVYAGRRDRFDRAGLDDLLDGMSPDGVHAALHHQPPGHAHHHRRHGQPGSTSRPTSRRRPRARCPPTSTRRRSGGWRRRPDRRVRCGRAAGVPGWRPGRSGLLPVGRRGRGMIWPRAAGGRSRACRRNARGRLARRRWNLAEWSQPGPGPAGPAGASPIGSEVLDWRTLDERSSRVANALSASGGSAPGDRVAFIGKNAPDVLRVLFGAAKLGAVTVAVNWRLSAGRGRPSSSRTPAPRSSSSTTEFAPVFRSARRETHHGQDGGRVR